MAGAPGAHQARGAALLLCVLLAAAGASAQIVCTVPNCAYCRVGPKNCGVCNSGYTLIFSSSWASCVVATPTPQRPPSPTFPDYIPFPSGQPAAPTPTPTRFCPSIAGIAKTGNLNSFIAAMKAAGLWTYISNRSLVATVFAPTDAAFAKLLKKYGVTSAQLLTNQRVIVSIMKNHVVPGGKLSTAKLRVRTKPLPTLTQPKTLRAVVKSGVLRIQPSGGRAGRIVKSNLSACKASMQVVDTVLVPSHYWKLGSNGKATFPSPPGYQPNSPPPSTPVVAAPAPGTSAASAAGMGSAFALACGLAGAAVLLA